MKVHILPKTRPGKWSVLLLIGFIVFFGLFFILVATGQRGGETFFSNLFLTVPVLIAAVSGIAAFFAGITGIIKDRERGVIVYMSTLIGFLILLYCLAELIFPH